MDIVSGTIPTANARMTFFMAVIIEIGIKKEKEKEKEEEQQTKRSKQWKQQR